MFGATEDRTGAMAFARRGLNDRHHLRFIVTPEDAAEMTDLKAFTRDLVTSLARLRAISAPGWGLASPTGNTDTRVCIPWCAASQMTVDLVISRDYISHGLRSRAADLVSAELRSKPEHEIRSALAREVEAERWNRLDAAIWMAADDSSSSTGGWTIRASTIRRRAVSPSAVAEAGAHGARHSCRAGPMNDRS